MIQYLKPQSYYEDLYDLLTIKECLRIIQFWQKAYKERSNDKEINDLPEEEKIKGFSQLIHWELLARKAEEFRRKKDAIREWIERDRKEQDKYDNTSEPNGIYCSNCKSLMHSTSRIVESFTDEPLRVLFFFDCPSCKKRKGIYENGEEHVSKPKPCPKCGKEIIATHKKKRNVISWTNKCSSCKYSETEIEDFDRKRAEWKKQEQEDQSLLVKYRQEFCLSEEKGKEAIEFFEKLKVANEVFEEEKQKYGSSVYQRSIQLKKLGIVELEKLINEYLQKEKFINLSLNKPEIEQYVIVPFTVQDSEPSRKGYDSVNSLQKLLKLTLEDTNWRLISNSLSFRLGYLSGQLKGYEREEDMLELAGKKSEQKPKKIDQEKRMKYGGDNMVQLARLFGQHEGIENMRKKRLEKEPDGFFLEASEGPYTCCICKETLSGNIIWWNLDGLRCADCWRNIKEGIIPALTWKNDNVWIQDWQIHSDYGVHPSTARKLRREGLLKGRDLKRTNGTIYCTLYLVSENKEFIKKYPKKESNIQISFSTSDKK